MNGLDCETALGDTYGAEKVLYCIAVGIDALREGRSVTYTRTGKLIFGEAVNTTISPRVARVQAALARAGLGFDTPTDMIRMLWWKFMVNVGINQASAVMRAPYGLFQTDADAQALMETLMREVIALARHLGVELTERDIAEWYSFLNTLSPQGKTSMLQDIEAGRRTEVESSPARSSPWAGPTPPHPGKPHHPPHHPRAGAPPRPLTLARAICPLRGLPHPRKVGHR